MKDWIVVLYQQSDLSRFPSDYTPGIVTTETTSTSSTIEGAASATASSPGSANTTTAGSGLSTGAQAGIGVGVAVVVLLALVSVALLFRRKRRQRSSMEQGAEYTGKQELDASSEKKPSPEVAELPNSSGPRGKDQWNMAAHAEHHELPGSNFPSTPEELDSAALYEVSGSSKTEQPNSRAQIGSQADTGMADGALSPATTVEPLPPAARKNESSAPEPTAEVIPPAASKYIGTPTSLEDLELQYLENEERRIQERKLQLLRGRAVPVIDEK
jgi:hypothetical protein